MERIITKSFARLMGRGVHRGFITHEELNKSLGKRNLSNENSHALPTRVPEYTVYKKPIIFSKCPPFTDYFTHRKDAFFVSNKNTSIEIAQALIILYRDRELCNKIGVNCYALSRNIFSIDVIKDLSTKISNLNLKRSFLYTMTRAKKSLLTQVLQCLSKASCFANFS